MQQILLRCLLLAMLLSCSNPDYNQTLAFIPGTYTRSEVREFGRIEDTITIQIQHRDVSSFLIEQRWRYERVLDGKAQEPEYKVITDQGIFNPKTKLLQNQRNLRFYSFDEKKQVLYTGTMIFQKLK